MPTNTDLPRLAAPARRALASLGITWLQDLVKYREAEIAGLHGIGPNALKNLKQAMAENDLKFSG
jgi:hypothetical protein